MQAWTLTQRILPEGGLLGVLRALCCPFCPASALDAEDNVRFGSRTAATEENCHGHIQFCVVSEGSQAGLGTIITRMREYLKLPFFETQPGVVVKNYVEKTGW